MATSDRMMAENEENPAPSFERHIRLMFREEIDVAHMSFRLDLTSYEDVKNNSDRILERLKDPDGPMPPENAGGPWPHEWIALFERWIEEGHFE